MTAATAQKLLEGGTQPVPAQQARAAPPTRPLAAVEPDGPRQKREEHGARAEVKERSRQPALAVGGTEQMLEVERHAEPAS
eukprot:scaffold55481_cov32-Phaeocystis_antarctica.AAC.1